MFKSTEWKLQARIKIKAKARNKMTILDFISKIKLLRSVCDV